MQWQQVGLFSAAHGRGLRAPETFDLQTRVCGFETRVYSFCLRWPLPTPHGQQGTARDSWCKAVQMHAQFSQSMAVLRQG